MIVPFLITLIAGGVIIKSSDSIITVGLSKETNNILIDYRTTFGNFIQTIHVLQNDLHSLPYACFARHVDDYDIGSKLNITNSNKDSIVCVSDIVVNTNDILKEIPILLKSCTNIIHTINTVVNYTSLAPSEDVKCCKCVDVNAVNPVNKDASLLTISVIRLINESVVTLRHINTAYVTIFESDNNTFLPKVLTHIKFVLYTAYVTLILTLLTMVIFIFKNIISIVKIISNYLT